MFKIGDFVQMTSKHPDAWDHTLWYGKITNILSKEFYQNIRISWYNQNHIPQGYSMEGESFLDKYDPFDGNDVLKDLCSK